MAVFSKVLSLTARNSLKNLTLVPKNGIKNNTPTRFMSGHQETFVIQPSRWQWHKTKDLLHMYIFVAAIPLSIITFCANVFIGPATLTPIPEGYEPKYWEYFRSPITRWLARYIFRTPQMDYEKMMHFIYEESRVMKIRKLENKIYDLMQERQDYKWGYFLPYNTLPAHEARVALQEQFYAQKMDSD